MRKFCSNCGAALDEGAAFCGNCGSKVPQSEAAPAPQVIPAEEAAPQYVPAEQAAPQFVPAEQAAPQFVPAEQTAPQFTPANQAAPQYVPAASVAPAKKPVNRKAWIIGGAVVAAVAIIAVVLIIVLGGGAASPKAAVDNYVALYNGDIDKLEGMAPAEYWEYLADEEDVSKKELLKELKEEMEEGFEYMKEEFGKNYKVTGKIESEDKMDKDDLEGIAEALSEYGIKESDVKEGKELVINLTIKGSEDSDDATLSFSAIKIGSSWYLIQYREYDGEYLVRFSIG